MEGESRLGSVCLCVTWVLPAPTKMWTGRVIVCHPVFLGMTDLTNKTNKISSRLNFSNPRSEGFIHTASTVQSMNKTGQFIEMCLSIAKYNGLIFCKSVKI